MIQSTIDIQKSIEKLNELDDAFNVSKSNSSSSSSFKIDISEMLERAVVQFSFIAIQLEKCPTNESLQTVN